jgi:two-component system response regulator
MTLDHVEILLIEDNDEDAELTTRALRKNKLTNRLHRLVDGAEALDYLFGSADHVRDASPAPKVILLDLKLPKVDGLEILRRLKQDKTLQAVPVVVLTSSREDRDLQEAYRLGVNSYIVKPVEFDKFVHAVEQLGMYWALLNERPR